MIPEGSSICTVHLGEAIQFLIFFVDLLVKLAQVLLEGHQVEAMHACCGLLSWFVLRQAVLPAAEQASVVNLIANFS